MTRSSLNTEAYLLLSRRTGERSAWSRWFSDDLGQFDAKLRAEGRALALPQPFSKVVLALSFDRHERMYVSSWSTQKVHALKGLSSLCGFYMLELIRVLAPQRTAIPGVFEAFDEALIELSQSEDIDHCRALELALLLAIDAVPDPYVDAAGTAIEPAQHYHIDDGQWRRAEAGLLGREILPLQQADAKARSLRRLCRFCVDQALNGRTLKTRKVLAQW